MTNPVEKFHDNRTAFAKDHKLQLTLDGDGGGFIVPMDAGDILLDEMQLQEMEEGQEWKIKCIKMTDKELDALPEFDGF